MSTTADRFAEHLTASTGAGAAAPPELLARVNAACAREGFAAVLAPDSADGAAAVLAICSAEGWPVLPIGAGTWLDPRGGPTRGGDVTPPAGVAPGRRATSTGADEGAVAGPETRTGDDAVAPGAAATARPPVLLSTVRLNRIIEHEPADLVIGVQGGVTLEQLDAALAAKQQWLPLDPAAAPHATIGAVAANASAGPLRAGHGTPRDMVLGVEIATGDGRLLRFGGRVVKNVAGYDGVRLTVGSRGALGLITALYLRVRGAARADRTLAVACGTGEGGARRGADLALALRDGAGCDAIELLSPAAAGRTGLVQPGWHVLVRLLGSVAAVTEAFERCQRIASGHETADVENDRPAAEVPSAVWDSLARLEASAGTAVRVTGPATGLADVTAALGRDVPTEAEGGWLMAAHAADGVIRLWRSSGPDGGPNDLAEWGTTAVTDGWTMMYDRPYELSISGRRDPRSDAEARRALAARLRTVFDPAAIMRGPWEV